MAQSPQHLSSKVSEQILGFGSHIAGSSKTIAAYVCGDYALGLADSKSILEVIIIIRGFQPKLMNYLKTFDGKNSVILAVDQGVFEMDADKGFLGEAVTSGLIFPYIALANDAYLHVQEVKLKKRLIKELLENLVLDFPELSYEVYIKPEYFLYESMLNRARLFPPTVYTVWNFMRKDIRKKNVEIALKGYKEALKQLEQENIIYFSKGYVRICRDFVDKAKSRRTQLVNLFKPAQKAMFTSMLGIFPKVVNLLSQNRGWLAKFQRIVERDSEIIHEIDDPQKYLYVATASELVPLTSEIGIEAFAREVLSADAGAEVTIEKIGGVLNDAFLIKTTVDGVERKVVVKRFKDWSSIKWFPLTLWTVGTRTFTVLGRSRLEKECTINQLLYSKGFAVPKLLYVNHTQRLLFMEYIEGETIDKVIRRTVESKSAKETKEGLEVIARVGEKIAQVHSLGIALGDTKPENILQDKQGKICLLDLEQASRGGDKVWDIAEFLYYSGHYISPFANVKSAEAIAEAFIKGYLKEGGNADTVRKAGNPKYTKVFSVFTFPHIMLVMSNACRKTRKLEG